jgi:hypothetical protein
MAIACLRLVTFLPLRPDFNLPCFISRISRSTFLPAEGEYLREEAFFAEDFREADFFTAEAREVFFALAPRVERPEVRECDPALFGRPLALFFVAFFVAITILLAGQMASSSGQVVCRSFCSGDLV